MSIFSTLHLSARIIGLVLFPPQPSSCERPGWAGAEQPAHPPGYIPVATHDLPYYLGDLNRAVDQRGELALFFPGCPAVAAPFLLFRLKRSGFSSCRAMRGAGGLLLAARR
jgi:hypothetical protein